MNRRLERVQIVALRVALMSTGITAAAFTVIAIAVVLYVNQTLTAQIDTRLATSLTRIQNTGVVSVPPLVDVHSTSGYRFAPPLLAWVFDGNGALLASNDTDVALPNRVRSMGAPTCAWPGRRSATPPCSWARASTRSPRRGPRSSAPS